MWNVKYIVHILNSGGLHPIAKEMNQKQIEILYEEGRMTDGDYEKACVQLEQASQPVREQFQFTCFGKLPFVPRTDVTIAIGKYVVTPEFVHYDPESRSFVVHSTYTLCSDSNCPACHRDLKYFMDDANGWAMGPPADPPDREHPFSGRHGDKWENDSTEEPDRY